MNQIAAVVPAYNEAHVIGEAIASLLAQAEISSIYIVDDGSSDDTAHVVRRLASSSCRSRPIKLISGPNRGPAQARNLGITLCQASMIALLDADDIMQPGFISRALEEFKSQPELDFVTSGLELFGHKTGIWNPLAHDCYGIRYDNCFANFGLIRRSIWAKIGGFRECLPFCEYWDFWIRALNSGMRVKKFTEAYLRYRQDGSGLHSNYVTNRENFNLALMIVANSELYPCQEVILAQNQLCELPDSWFQKLLSRQNIYSNSWEQNFILGLRYERCGEQNTAQVQYIRALELSPQNQKWQIHYRIGVSKLSLGQKVPDEERLDALKALYLARNSRPDLKPYLCEYL